ncbi:MAG: anthranilate phosphoribosyltransferase [Akkermansia sp.]
MFLLIDNYDSFTYNLVQAFYGLGRTPVVMTNDDPRLLDLATDPTLQEVCISPGPSNPEKAGLCLEFLKRLPTHIPVLGVCLGHQILGHFAGAEVARAPYVMHGKCSEIVHDGMGLFAGLPNPMKVGRYHSLVVISQEESPNSLFSVTARGPEGEVMALRYNDRPWVGIQFHPESILTPDGITLLSHFPDSILPSQHKERRISHILDTLAEGHDLTAQQASEAFADIMDGRMTTSQAGSFLMGLRMKGETPLELAHAVSIGLSRAVRVDGIAENCIDVVGTGGDGKSSFNCSTATALTLAGMGYKVIKHGNRAVSSSSGSADVLESLGFPLEIEPEDVRAMLDADNFAFLFAPRFHPAFRNVGSVRTEMGIRTLFNLLGPLINPARPSHVLLGVARPEIMDLYIETLKQSQVLKGAVVHGAGGYDELTPLGINKAIVLDHGKTEALAIDPSDYGIAPCTEEDIAVHSKSDALAAIKAILSGKGSQAMRDMVTLNVGLGIYLLEQHEPLSACMLKAQEAVSAGVGRRVIHAS